MEQSKKKRLSRFLFPVGVLALVAFGFWQTAVDDSLSNSPVQAMNGKTTRFLYVPIAVKGEPTVIGTASVTPAPTVTPTNTATSTNTATQEPSPTPTSTQTVTNTPTPTSTSTPTSTPTPTATDTPGENIIVYGSNSYGNQELIAINLSQNSYEQVGTLAFPTQAMAQDSLTGYVYYFESQKTGNRFGYWDPATATNHIIRVYQPAPGFYAKRMDFSPDGTLYMMDNEEGLFTIDKITGNYTFWGTVTGMVTGSYHGTGDMAFAPDGTLYVNTYENLYSIDLNSLQATLVASDMIEIGQGTNTMWTGLAYCEGQFYASDIDIDTEENTAVSALFHFDPGNGTTTFLFYTNYIINDLTSCSP